jgi:precorrin-6Y C5,15-methyltransferase (decarboxylating)
MDHPEAGQLSAGLPDEVFVTDGLLTKRVLRAFALAVLAPTAGERLWDLGAGTGSIGIEWCRLHPDNTAIAVERNADRAARIGLNATTLGVAAQLEVVVADITATLASLAPPDAVFLGGGVDADVLAQCWQALRPGGRVAAHSVTAESDVVLLDAYHRWGGELNRVAVETAEPIGRFTGFRPLRTVTTWAGIRS